MRKEHREEMWEFLAQAIDEGSKDVVSLAVSHFGISRQAIHRHLAVMASEGILVASGKTRARTYSLLTLEEKSVKLAIAEHPAEHEVWQEHFRALTSQLPRNVVDICYHGFTEMFNNAVDHSEGTKVIANLCRTFLAVDIYIIDDGVGIFAKIKKGLNLASEREAVLELTKGKVTTDPTRHSGEGIFFTSRMFDRFRILSGRLFFQHKAPDDDWFVDSKTMGEGTSVGMRIGVKSERTPREVFDRFTSSEDMPAFDKTCLPVAMLCIDTQGAVSRSQAKRLLAGIDKFKQVVLDFEGVPGVGQAFADEVFRVFKQQHPAIEISYTRANDDVVRMIRRTQNAEPSS